MVGKNGLKTQLQTGAIGKQSIVTSVKDSGAMSVTLTSGAGTVGDDNTTVLMEQNCNVAKYSKTKCGRGAQTDVSTLPAAVIVGRHSMEGPP